MGGRTGRFDCSGGGDTLYISARIPTNGQYFVMSLLCAAFTYANTRVYLYAFIRVLFTCITSVCRQIRNVPYLY